MATFAPTGPASPSTVANLFLTTPVITNESLLVSGTEYAVVIPAGSVKFRIYSRKHGKLQYSYTSGQSGLAYLTIESGNSHTEEGITSSASLTIYIQSSKASDILEVLTWT